MTQASDAKAEKKADEKAAKLAAVTGPLTPAEHKELQEAEARIVEDTKRVAQLKARQTVVEYPKALYKARVREKHRDGTPDGRVLAVHGADTTFDASTTRVVQNEKERDEAVADGWFEDLAEALKAGKAEAAKEAKDKK